jgi:hypothetical protein
VDGPIRGHRTRSTADKSPSRWRPYRASIEWLCIHNRDGSQGTRLRYRDILFWRFPDAVLRCAREMSSAGIAALAQPHNGGELFDLIEQARVGDDFAFVALWF